MHLGDSRCSGQSLDAAITSVSNVGLNVGFLSLHNTVLTIWFGLHSKNTLLGDQKTNYYLFKIPVLVTMIMDGDGPTNHK